jgi:predicted ABC-type sugar transport system permease subunit
MWAKVLAAASATFVLVSLGITFGVGNLLHVCGYQFSPTTLCGMGVCDAPMSCSLWAPAIYLGPVFGVVAGLGVARLVRTHLQRSAA